MKLRMIIEMDASIDSSLEASPIKSSALPNSGNDLVDTDSADPEFDSMQDSDVESQLSAQKDAEDQMRQQQKQVMSPVLNKINKNFGNINQSILKGREQSQQSAQSMNGLDKELTDTRSLLANLEKLL